MPDSEYDKKIKAINEAYAESLPAVLNDIALLWEKLLVERDVTQVTTLSNSCHRLAGSASMFGHAEVGRIAHSIENILGKVVHEGHVLSDEEIAIIDQHVTALKALVNKPV